MMQKSSPIFLKVAQIVSTANFSQILTFSKQPKKVNGYVGYFCRKFSHQVVLKISQSDHTDDH